MLIKNAWVIDRLAVLMLKQLLPLAINVPDSWPSHVARCA